MLRNFGFPDIPIRHMSVSKIAILIATQTVAYNLPDLVSIFFYILLLLDNRRQRAQVHPATPEASSASSTSSQRAENALRENQEQAADKELNAVMTALKSQLVSTSLDTFIPLALLIPNEALKIAVVITVTMLFKVWFPLFSILLNFTTIYETLTTLLV